MNSGFLGLVKNENMKIYRRPRTWILAAIILVVVIGAGLIMKQVSPGVGANEWQDKAKQELKSNKQTLKDLKDAPQTAKVQFQTKVKELQYELDHDINPYETNSWTFVNQVLPVAYALVLLFAVIVASDIVAGEFSRGTIKMLMVRPHPRWSILLSKYLASVIFGVVLLFELLASTWLMGGFVYGFGGLDSASYSVEAGGEVVKQVTSLSALQASGLAMLSIFFVMTIAFMISTIFRTSALAIGISILMYFMITNLVVILAQYEWTKYLVFTNLDLTTYLNFPDGLIEGMSIPFSIWINAGYWLIFVVVTWIIFQKRDIAT